MLHVHAAALALLTLAALIPGTELYRETPGTGVSEPPSQSDDPKVTRATLRLVLASESVEPGSVVDLGVSFAIDPGWHLYWEGRNQTGEAPKVRLDLPRGITAGATLWPVPTRHIAPGGILDHIYDRDVTLVIPLTIAEEVELGQSFTIRAECSWMVCADVCVLESGAAEATIRSQARGAGRPPGPGSNKGFLVRAREHLPVPFGPEVGSARVVSPGGEGQTRPNPRAEIVVAGASILEFYPGVDCAELADFVKDTRSESDRLDIGLVLSQQSANKELRGVLGVWRRPEGKPAYYLLNTGPAR